MDKGYAQMIPTGGNINGQKPVRTTHNDQSLRKI